MAELTRQYLGYVEMMRRTQLELAAEYLLMAAVLIEIKSRLLLPKPPALPGTEPEDPRAELVRRLLEYERMKEAARKIDALPLAERDFATCQRLVRADRRRPVSRKSAPEDLRTAWAGLLARARINRHHLVSREQLSVRAEMSRILKTLEPSRFAEFTTLFAGHADVPHLIVTFLALLELAREQLVAIAQTEPYAPIYVQLTGSARRLRAPGILHPRPISRRITVLRWTIRSKQGIFVEAALLTAGEPVAIGTLAKLFDPPLDTLTVQQLLAEIAADWTGKSVELVQVASGWRFQCKPDRPVLSRPAHAGKAAALLARGDGNPGDHRLSATRDPRRYRSHPRRRRVHQRHQGAGGPPMGRSGRPSRDAGPPGALRDHQDLPRRSRPRSLLRSSLRWPSSTLPTCWRPPMHPPKPPKRNSRSRSRSWHRPPTGPMQQPSLALQQITESLAPPRHQSSTDEVFTEPQRLHKVLASCGFGSRRAMEEMILAGPHHREPRARRRRARKSDPATKCGSTASSSKFASPSRARGS